MHLVLCSLELRFEAKAPRGRGPSDDPIRGTRLWHRISCRRWTCGSTRARLDNGVLEGQRHQWGRLGTALPYWYRSPWQFLHDESDASHPTWVGYKPLVLPQIRPLPYSTPPPPCHHTPPSHFSCCALDTAFAFACLIFFSILNSFVLIIRR
jgi:hypothetical protein